MAPRWTWNRISSVLTERGYVCKIVVTRLGKAYQILPPLDTFNKTPHLFDTVEEIRDAFGFRDPIQPHLTEEDAP